MEPIEHYGTKGMKWESTRKQSLDRIYRVASGTESRRDRMQKALKVLAKELDKKVKEEENSDKTPIPPEKSKEGKPSIDEFLKQIGSVRLIDLDS
jgi:hypothetical protein